MVILITPDFLISHAAAQMDRVSLPIEMEMKKDNFLLIIYTAHAAKRRRCQSVGTFIHFIRIAHPCFILNSRLRG